MSIKKCDSQMPFIQKQLKCGEPDGFFDGLMKGYSDCHTWCSEKCPTTLSQLHVQRIIQECKKECRQFQIRCPVNQ